MTIVDDDSRATARRHRVSVCRYDDLAPERGVAALIAGRQVAIFRLHDGTVRAVGHHDPCSGANVMARGIVGSRGGIPTVTSPMYKQVYSLITGECLDDEQFRLEVFDAAVTEGLVRISPRPVTIETAASA